MPLPRAGVPPPPDSVPATEHAAPGMHGIRFPIDETISYKLSNFSSLKKIYVDFILKLIKFNIYFIIIDIQLGGKRGLLSILFL
jgi:hypothetical protein